MPKMVDISGQRFGRLVAKERVGTKWGKALWSFDCDCGTKDFLATQNAVSSGKKYTNGQRRGHGGTQSCGCWNKECLFFGPNPHRIGRPRIPVKITYPAPENLHPKPEINAIMREMVQLKWERVEFEARKIERAMWKEPKHTPFIPRDGRGNVIPKLDLFALSRAKATRARAEAASLIKLEEIRDIPASCNTGSSLADRVRIVTDEEWVRLSR